VLQLTGGARWAGPMREKEMRKEGMKKDEGEELGHEF